MAREIKEITLGDAHRLVGRKVYRYNTSVGCRDNHPHVVTGVRLDKDGDIEFQLDGDLLAWVTTPTAYGHDWIAVDEPPAAKTELEQLQEQRAEIDAKIKAEEERIARVGAPEGWEWDTILDDVRLRYRGDSDDLPAFGVTYIAWNRDKETGEVYLDGDGAVVVHVDPLLAWLRKAGVLDSKA